MINLAASFGLCLVSAQELLSFAGGRLEKQDGGHFGGPGTGHLERGDYRSRGEPVPGKKFCYFCKDCNFVDFVVASSNPHTQLDV